MYRGVELLIRKISWNFVLLFQCNKSGPRVRSRRLPRPYSLLFAGFFRSPNCLWARTSVFSFYPPIWRSLISHKVLHIVLPPVHLEHDPNVKLLLKKKEFDLLTQCADQVYETILSKLTQLQTLTGGTGMELSNQVQNDIKSLQVEKTVFMEKLERAKEQQMIDSDTTELRHLTR